VSSPLCTHCHEHARGVGEREGGRVPWTIGVLGRAGMAGLPDSKAALVNWQSYLNERSGRKSLGVVVYTTQRPNSMASRQLRGKIERTVAHITVTDLLTM